MLEIINELATIEVSEEVLEQLDIDNISRSFRENYRKLDDLKNFRSDYENKNIIMRWWHSDKLSNAQLDSAEVQAEFSKTIGQLLMISIMQSKKLSEQQTLLNNQQHKLKFQANDIIKHANELQSQHRTLADQSEKLENLMHEYFQLKGLTEDGVQKLIDIAKEVKSTKEKMLGEFSIRAKHIEVQYGNIADRINQNEEKNQTDIVSVQNKTYELISALEFALRKELDSVQHALSQGMKALEKILREIEVDQNVKNSMMESKLSSMSTKQVELESIYQESLGIIQAKFSEQETLMADEISVLKREMNSEFESALQKEHESVQRALSESKEQIAEQQRQLDSNQQAKNTSMELSLSSVSTKLEAQATLHSEQLDLIQVKFNANAERTTDTIANIKKDLSFNTQQQQSLQKSLETLQSEMSGRIKRLGYLATGLLLVVLGMAGQMAHIVSW